jgi:hypothetical protein
LGGNYASPANGAQISYVVFVVEKEVVNTPTPTPSSLPTLSPTPSPPVSTPSGLTISDLNVSNGKGYQVDKVSRGGLLYIDRNYTITSFPVGFNNGLIIKTAADDKFETATSFLRFRVNRAADIYVAYDRRASVLPNWLSSQFTKVSGMTVGASEPNLSYFNLYKKTLNEAGEVVLGGNYASPANGAQISYVVFVVEKEAVNTPTPTPTPAALEVYNLNPSRYRVVSLATGIKYFVDRSDKIKSYPSSLTEGLLIMTANDDKSQTSADFLSFTINKSANIYVAYDRRAKSLPFWLSSFVGTGERIEVSGDSMGYFKLYRKAYPAGKVVLGGNLASGAKGARTNYIVIIK